MNRNRVEKIIEYVKGSPETMDYGRWGALNPEQRKNIKELCNSWLILDKATNIQTKEIERLNNIINGLEKDLIDYFKKEYPDRKLEDYNLENCTYDYALVILGRLQELKGINNN